MATVNYRSPSKLVCAADVGMPLVHICGVADLSEEYFDAITEQEQQQGITNNFGKFMLCGGEPYGAWL